MTAKIIPFPGTYQSELKVSAPSAEESSDVRLRRIKARLERINQLMSDIKELGRRQKQLEETLNE